MYTILRFTIENFRSIAEQKSIVFTPVRHVDGMASNVAERGKYQYFRTAVIYGANSSGKSNLVRGLAAMRYLVSSSVKINDAESLSYEPFLLSSDKAKEPTLYELDFLIDGVHYRYGFSNTDRKICEEWLIYIDETGHATKLFDRDEEGIGVNEEDFKEGKDCEERTNDNRLFLSLVGQLGGEISNKILRSFSEQLHVLSGLETENYESFTGLYLKYQRPGCDKMNEFFRRMQLGFSKIDLQVRSFSPEDLPKEMPEELREKLCKNLSGAKQTKVFSTHGIYDQEGNKIKEQVFDFKKMESTGTQKLFAIAGPIFDTLHNGCVLMVDELDAKMHPLITKELVDLFNDPERNVNGAQLIFTTHDTNLLSSHLLRQDQVWFTEKDEQERTDVYSMAQIRLPNGNRPKNEMNLERNYISGRYGAIPYISPLNRNNG